MGSRIQGCIGVINKTITRGGGGQVVLANKRNTSTSPQVVATRIQDSRLMEVPWSVVVRLSPRNGAKDSTEIRSLDDWLTVHRSITLVNFQLDTQNSLFIYIQYIY